MRRRRSEMPGNVGLLHALLYRLRGSAPVKFLKRLRQSTGPAEEGLQLPPVHPHVGQVDDVGVQLPVAGRDGKPEKLR